MKHNLKRTICLVAFVTAFLAGTAVAYAQDLISVKGTVSDSFGGLMGASVIVKGTTNGTTTDSDGNFTIYAKEGDILEVSFLGFQTQEVSANGGGILRFSFPKTVRCLPMWW